MICKYRTVKLARIIKGLALIMSFFMVSCGSTSVTVSGKYPAPLTSQLPLTATLLIDREFREYLDRPNKDLFISFGTAQSEMIERVLGQRFQLLTVVSSVPQTINTDILIVPKVAGVQVGIPSETHLGIYEVWIKYSLEIRDKSNELIAKWFMPAYGKTPSAFMTSEKKAIDTAAQVALRDAGVRMITDLHRIPEFHYWVVQLQKIKEQSQPPSQPQRDGKESLVVPRVKVAPTIKVAPTVKEAPTVKVAPNVNEVPTVKEVPQLIDSETVEVEPQPVTDALPEEKQDA